jgi:hypothetical protein
MTKWDEKYIVTELKQVAGGSPWSPMFTDKESMRLICLDSDVRKGAFYMETAWFWPGKWPETKSDEGTVKPHQHEFDEAIAYIGTDPNDPYNLNGEIEIWIDGKENIIDRSFIAFVPAGIEHGPLTIRRIDKPIFHFTAGMEKKYL